MYMRASTQTKWVPFFQPPGLKNISILIFLILLPWVEARSVALMVVRGSGEVYGLKCEVIGVIVFNEFSRFKKKVHHIHHTLY